MSPPNTKAAQSEATRAKLLAAARTLFGERGYADVGTEEIVRAAGVTRGALYHQFADKRALFRAVFEDLEAELVREAASGLDEVNDLLGSLKAGCRGWLEACLRPEAERIVLTDAPAVLGWQEWREIGESHGMGVVMALLQSGMEAGVLTEQPVRPLAHVVIGALDEMALYVTRSDDRETALAEAVAIFDRLVDSLAS